MNERDHTNKQGDASLGEGREFTAAMSRLEKAVQDLVTVTRGQISDRATTLLDETSKRIESELRLRQVADDEPSRRRQERRRRRHRFRHRFSDRTDTQSGRGGRLYRDDDAKIGGVCAGLARYFGVETWIVRMGALTGLIFLPGIVFPAYWIAYFIMDRKPSESDPFEDTPPSGRERGRDRFRAQRNEPGPERHDSIPPRRILRHTTADLTQVELKLRRLESYVTSNRYELQKELTRIEREGGAQS